MRRLPVRLLVVSAAVTAALVAATALAARGRDEWTVSSPDGVLAATVTGKRGAYALTVRRDGRRVLDTPLGRADASRLRVTKGSIDETYATPAGKRRQHRLTAHRMTLAFAHGRSIEVLVADDGVAFRQTSSDREVTAWRAPTGARAWLQRYRPDYEARYQAVDLRAAGAGDYGFPALVGTGAGTWALLTESGLTREPAAHLTVARGRPGVLRVALPEGDAMPQRTPWRVAVIGDLETVVSSDLPLSLGRPSRIRDTSWIHPGRVAWSWWSDHDSPGDIDRQRDYVRAASNRGWEYVLLDEGWRSRDVPRIAGYAARNNVRLMLWTDWHRLADPRRRQRLLARWASWGVAGVKVDFLLSDSARRMAIYEDIARDAAQRHLVIVFHGCTIPRGIQRTWPNVLTMEAVRGAERETPDQGGQVMDARHDVNLAFTRNVIGSMDYTPVTFSARNRETTDGHRLALAVVYESGLQHFADSPEVYDQHPQAEQLLADVPTAWDDTRLLSGAPDREATVARRSGETWWIGSISATSTRDQTVPLRFLTPGRSYRMHLVRDDGHGGLAVEDRTVSTGDKLTVSLPAAGGFAAEFTPA